MRLARTSTGKVHRIWCYADNPTQSGCGIPGDRMSESWEGTEDELTCLSIGCTGRYTPWVESHRETDRNANPTEPVPPTFDEECTCHDPDLSSGEQDWTNPSYCLGAVLVQIEDLEPADKLGVLAEALATVAAEVRR